MNDEKTEGGKTIHVDAEVFRDVKRGDILVITVRGADEEWLRKLSERQNAENFLQIPSGVCPIFTSDLCTVDVLRVEQLRPQLEAMGVMFKEPTS